MADTTEPLDPGWRESLRGFLFFTHIPWRAKKSRTGNPISVLRSLYLCLFLAGFLILYVLVFISPFGDPEPGLALALAVPGVAFVSASMALWRRPLSVESAGSLVVDFRSRFFLCYALSEFPLLGSFIVSMLVDEYWPFLIGLACFSIGMIAIAPSRRTFRRRDEELAARGSPLSLTRAFAETSPSDHEG